MLKILSYNVNGLRAVIGKGFNEWLEAENPDIICLQETKIQGGQVDTSVYEKMGYKHFWHYAQKKGYSGVALLSKTTPVKVSYGIGVDEFDDEGRTVLAILKILRLFLYTSHRVRVAIYAKKLKCVFLMPF